MALPAECWRWVPGFEGIAQVSTRGRVRSVDRWVTDSNGKKRFYKGRILKQARGNSGYFFVNLRRNGKQHHCQVHRLVAMAFIPNPDGKPEVNHLNEQKDMNFVENLSWVSRIENVNWGTGRERAAASRLNGSLSKAVEAIDPNTGEVVREFPSANEAERNGFTSISISRCCRGIKCKRHKGYIWRYKE